MKKNTKRFLSLALAMVLVLTNAPLQIFAEGDARPNATVTTLPSTTLEAGEYQVWNGSLTEGTEDLPLQIVMNFKANDTFEQAQASKYAKWRCDFYLTFEGLEGDSVSGDGSYLAGNYGDYGWIKIPTDGLEVEEGVEYPVVSNYDANLTYENVCDYVKEFTAALYVNPVILRANPDMKVTLKLKMTDPQNEDNVLVIGKPAVYKAEDLLKMPNATVTTLDPMTLDASEYTVWDGSSLKEGTEAIMLQAVMHFKANDTFEQAQAGGYGKWKCDFYLTFEGLEGGSVSGNGSYLAGNYGSYGWIKIPTDGLEVEEGVEYPIVTNYDANLTYENVCDYVKEFTAALYIDPATLQANPNMKVTLKLKMTNPENPDDVMVIGEPAVYTAQQLLAAKAKPQAEVTILDPITLPAGEYSVYTGSLATGDTARPLQILMNFKAKDSLAQAQAGGYGKWKCDFYLTFNGMESGSVLGDGSYLAGKYEDGGYDYLGWIVIPTDGLEVEEGVEYPIVSNYDANLTYENICDYVKSFTAALYVNPDVLEANRNMTVTLTLKMTNPDDPTETMIIGEPAVFSSPVLQGYVAHNTDTDKYYEDVNDANNEAKTGETVVLLTDVEVDKLFVSETFDLNGHTLTAKYVACYGSIVDGSDENTGLLKVDPDNILMRKANKQVPIRTEDGYRFVEILGFNMLYQAEKGRFVFQPLFEEYAHELVRAGAEVSGVAIQVNVTWKNAKGETRQQTFVYEDAAFLQGFFDSYNPETGKYSQMFTLVLATTAEVSYQIQVVSDSGTVHASGITAAAAPETTTTTEETTLNTNAEANQASALVPVGTKLSGNATSNSLKLTVENVQNSQSNIVLEDGEVRKSVDVHITGIAPDNTVPTIVTLLAFAEPGLNEGNFALYHVEYGKTKAMTKVAAPADVDTHNEFFYDPATGDVTMALATFSEIAMVSDTDKAWKGNFDYSWYTNAVAPLDGESTSVYIIANADQLAAFGAIVGGMNGQTPDSFAGKIVKLGADINLGDKESENNPNIIFYPIGYYNSEGTYERTNTAITSGLRNFEGTFDGNGHTISNFYQNTWEMKGDHDWYSPEEQYYRDGMGLFGKVYGGTVKNLTVKNFSSDGEIATTGVIAAYADGATFENIAIMNCNPRVYNIGNGGIVGCVGWYAQKADLKTTFKNITVDNSNKISALWGSYDVACGGIVGQYYPTSGQSSANYPVNAGIHFENCHVSAQMDVYNDVCGNYQYYAYRYTGMLIGSIRENVTIDGHVYPKMDGITASGCTVHFGTWNDYYYCEIIDNTTASYTHDYQMSRLTEIKAIDGTTITYLDGTTGTVPVSGRANYVIVDYTKGHGTENATCYHFKDGAVWTHDMGGIQTGIDENGDGQDDLKEDKQHIYLEFNNLVTGYGWGVTSKGVDDLAGVDILDKNLDGSSVEKFEGKVTELTTTKQYKLGDIFNFVDKGVVLVPGALMVSVHNLDENNPVSATFVRGTENWENGTITFSGAGKVTITIQDYYFCTPTTIEVTITDRQPEVKFDVVMNNGDFLHRVGNVGTVALDKLFKEKAGVTVGTVSVTIETVNGTAAYGTYTSNATWANGTIQFSGTGVVKVTITDNDYCTPTELYLEVVDAVNVTSAISLGTGDNQTRNNAVLLNNISGGFTVSDGYAFYGNGFKVTCAGNGSYRSAAVSYGFVTVENGGILDNVRIICDIFPESYMYASEMKAGSDGRYPYGYSAVVISGDSTISNSYIYGARNNIHVTSGNVTIDNTVTECGSLANIHIKSGNEYTVTLRNVTTIQYLTTSKYDTTKKVMGFGVLVGDNDSVSHATIRLEGDFKQYNWVNSSYVDGDNAISNTHAKTAIKLALEEEAYLHIINEQTTINMGIVFQKELDAKTEDQRSNKTSIPYSLSTINMLGYTGKVYSISAGSGITSDSRFDATTDGVLPYVPTANGIILPSITHSGTNGSSLTIGAEYDNGWLTTFKADLDNISDGNYTFKFSELVVKKNGISLEFTVKDSSGNTVSKDTEITLNQLATKNYTLIVTDNQIYNAKGELTGNSITHEMAFVLYATKTSIEPPKFTGIGSGVSGAIRLVTSAGGNWRPAYPALKGVSVEYWSASEGKMKTVDLSTLTNAGTINGTTWTYTCDDFTLKITGGPVHTTTSYVLSPMVATRNGEQILYFAAKNKDNTTGTTARMICLEYVFTDKNASTTVGQCTSYSNGIATVQYANLEEFSWNSFQNGKVEEVSSGTGSGTACLAEGTMITLADGSKKAVEDLRKGDLVMAFDHLTGKITSNQVIIVVKTAQDNYYKNTFVFDDGTELVTINEHGIFDLDLNKYVNIDHANFSEFIGHRFVSIDSNGKIGVKRLTEVQTVLESGYKYDVVTNETLNYVAEDTLSVTHVLVDIINSFDFGEALKYDAQKMQADIAEYGLYTYDEWEMFCDISVFEQYNIPVMKVGVAKGLYSQEYIVSLINTYVLDESKQIID